MQKIISNKCLNIAAWVREQAGIEWVRQPGSLAETCSRISIVGMSVIWQSHTGYPSTDAACPLLEHPWHAAAGSVLRKGYWWTDRKDSPPPYSMVTLSGFKVCCKFIWLSNVHHMAEPFLRLWLGSPILCFYSGRKAKDQCPPQVSYQRQQTIWTFWRMEGDNK